MIDPSLVATRVFFDDFHALDLSPDGHGSHTWYPGIWFNPPLPPAANITCANSILTLAWTHGQPGPDTSLTTFARDLSFGKSFRYGFFEASMRWKPETGAWPAFWLVPDVNVPHTGELDVFEGHNNNSYGALHEWLKGKSVWETSGLAYGVGADFTQWHNYGMLWTPGKVTWTFDGHPVGSSATPIIMDRQYYQLIVGMQCGTNWILGDMTGVTATRMALEVDWVSVWQLR